MKIETTIASLAHEYGVDLPAGFDGTEPLTLRRTDDGWTVRGLDLIDDDWAPTSDAQARQLAAALGEVA